MNNADIILIKVAWQLSLDHADADFDRTAIESQLKAHNIDTNDIGRTINKMIGLELLDVTEVGSLYRCSHRLSSSTLIEILVAPDVPCLHDAVLDAVKKAVEPFGGLVEVEDYNGE